MNFHWTLVLSKFHCSSPFIDSKRLFNASHSDIGILRSTTDEGFILGIVVGIFDGITDEGFMLGIIVGIFDGPVGFNVGMGVKVGNTVGAVN